MTQDKAGLMTDRFRRRPRQSGGLGSFMVAWALALAWLLGGPPSARAEVDWRLSIKVVADASGNIPASTLPRLNAEVARANRLLADRRRGYGFDLVELVTLTGVSEWYDSDPRLGATRAAVQAAARANPAAYRYRTDAVNVYVFGSFSGTCAFPSNGDDVITMGRLPYDTLLLHECGHFFDLRHTHEGEVSQAADGTTCTTCPCFTQRPGDQDLVGDTAPDHSCFGSLEAISQGAYRLPYNQLDGSRQEYVRNSFLNVMSYHGGSTTLFVLTPDQMDRMTDASNSSRIGVATGRTWYVATDGNDGNSGRASNRRLRTLAKGLSVAGDRDVVLLKSGVYSGPTVLNQPVTICATRGPVEIVAP